MVFTGSCSRRFLLRNRSHVVRAASGCGRGRWGWGACLVPAAAPAMDSMSRYTRHGSAAAWMCRLIPCAPTGGALPCGSAAWLCLIPPSARVCCCSSREARAPGHRQDHRRRQRHGAACRRVQASMGCGELRPQGHRAEQPDPLLTGPRPTRNGAAQTIRPHRRRIRGDRARQCGVHRKLPRATAS